eukprot:TRINITY_DN15300_c0_g1_i3.p1 TRINITY_DN15300_c0_g1~~TRINITY_DN15300_c0_g1_i3.p1  ORF type:complete len:131 (+),score=46.58 TRINITY_DN15300_c0_g1_i3:25-417(+)
MSNYVADMYSYVSLVDRGVLVRGTAQYGLIFEEDGFFFFFFFKQKTAYEMQRGLVGSEMCIRDRYQRRVHGVLLQSTTRPVSYTHLRAHETSLHLVCRLLLEKKKKKKPVFLKNQTVLSCPSHQYSSIYK